MSTALTWTVNLAEGDNIARNSGTVGIQPISAVKVRNGRVQAAPGGVRSRVRSVSAGLPPHPAPEDRCPVPPLCPPLQGLSDAQGLSLIHISEPTRHS